MTTAEILRLVSTICFVLAGIAFIVTVLMFFKFNIRYIYGELSGKNDKKTLDRIRTGKDTKNTDIIQPIVIPQTVTENIPPIVAPPPTPVANVAKAPTAISVNETHKLDQGYEDTNVLSGIQGYESTTIINNSQVITPDVVLSQTTVLQPSNFYGSADEGTTVLNNISQKDEFKFSIDVDISFLASDELINEGW